MKRANERYISKCQDEIARLVGAEEVQPIEIFLIAVPVLCEAIAVTLFIASCAIGIVIYSTPVPV